MRRTEIWRKPRLEQLERRELLTGGIEAAVPAVALAPPLPEVAAVPSRRTVEPPTLAPLRGEATRPLWLTAEVESHSPPAYQPSGAILAEPPEEDPATAPSETVEAPSAEIAVVALPRLIVPPPSIWTDASSIRGDFDGDGVEELGLFTDGLWRIDMNHNGRWDGEDLEVRMGGEGDVPAVGDWDGDGLDELAVASRAGELLVAELPPASRLHDAALCQIALAPRAAARLDQLPAALQSALQAPHPEPQVARRGGQTEGAELR